MTTLLLMRHGQSVWNLENRFTGFHDAPLTPEGEAEAARAGEKLRLAHGRPHGVFTSTLQRAWRTADIALEAAGWGDRAAARSDALRERDYGDLTGLNKAETVEKFGAEQVRLWRRSYDVPPPGGESLKDVVARVQPYYETTLLPLLARDQNLLVVAHGNSLRALFVVLGLYEPATIAGAEIPTGAPLCVHMAGTRAVRYDYL